MKRRVSELLSLVIMAMALTGCGSAIPEMTKEQEDMVVDYAVATLLKYDINHSEKLVKLASVEEALGEQELVEPESEQPVEEHSEQEMDVVKEMDEAGTENSEGSQDISVEELLGIPNVSLQCFGYEIDDIYPPNSEEIHFVMNAAEGSQLLVVKFTLQNLSSTEQTVSIQPGSVRIKMLLNGKEKNALTTMLLNDLASYQGTLEAGESVELVVIGEYKTEELQEIEKLDLKIKANESEAMISCSEINS